MKTQISIIKSIAIAMILAALLVATSMVLLIVGVLTLAGLWSNKNISLFCDIRITGVSTAGLKFMLCFMRVS